MADAALSDRPTPSTNPHLQAAQVASERSDWPMVLTHLQNLLQAEASILQDEATAQSILDLAMLVLLEGEFHQRWDGAKVLVKLGDRAIAQLIALIQDEDLDPDARWFAVRVLAEFQSPQVVPILIGLLQDRQDPELQTMAINSLGQMGPGVLLHLAPLYATQETRPMAAQILSLIRHSQTIPPLLHLAQDPQDATRAIALEALGSFHSPEIAKTLLAALQDRASSVRSAAVKGIGFCAQELPEVDWVAALMPILNDLNLDTCRHCAQTLSRIATPAAALALHQALQPSSLPEPLGLDFLRALGWIEIPAALAYLMEAAKNSHLTLRLRQEACYLMGRRPSARSHISQWLETYLPQSPPELHGAIVAALGQLGEVSAIMPLIDCLPEEDGHLRLHIMAALKAIDPDRAHQALSHTAKTQPDRLSLQRAIQEWR
jgi:HEAT repeat protein